MTVTANRIRAAMNRFLALGVMRESVEHERGRAHRDRLQELRACGSFVQHSSKMQQCSAAAFPAK